MLFSTQDIPTSLQALAVFGQGDYDITRVVVDSRGSSLGRDCAFFALVTPSGNGHGYLYEAYRRGVRCFVVSEWQGEWQAEMPQAVFVQVADTLLSLQSLAHNYRQRINPFVIGITGSNGKTIVKEMLYTLLSPSIPKLYRSPGSYNSQLGVALSLLAMPDDTEVAIIEAGISQRGEMERLAAIIKPNDVVITHLGTAHRENFDSLQDLYAEKLMLAGEGDTRLFYKLSPEQKPEQLQILSELLRLYPNAYNCNDSIAEDIAIIQETLSQRNHVLEANLHTALAYIRKAFPEYLHVARKSVGEITSLPMRVEIKENAKGHILINDSYSNDLDALALSLDVLGSYSDKDTAVVLGPIEQSGLSEDEQLNRVLTMSQKHGLRRIYLIGWSEEMITRVASEQEGHSSTLYSAETMDALLERYQELLLDERVLLVKGPRRLHLEELVRRLSMREHITRLEVDLSALRGNLAFYRSKLPQEAALICMIKADAYGLGAVEVARTLEASQHVSYLAVAVADEAKLLRSRGVEMPIIVMNPQQESLETLVRHQLDAEVYSLEMLALFGSQCSAKHRPGLHLKVDSGMHRLGFRMEDIPAIVGLIDKYQMRIASAFSHLAAADDEALDSFTHEQAEYLLNFYTCLCATLDQVAEYKKPLPRLHILNTAGIERFSIDYALGGARLGIGLYGFSPTSCPEVRPVARLVTKILQVKSIARGESIGYSCKHRLERDARIAVIPIGYADGLHRRYGNSRWSVNVMGTLCPIVGNICMDACMIDVTGVTEAREGTPVVVFGDELSPITALADVGDTIPYEVLTSISPRVARVYIN